MKNYISIIEDLEKHLVNLNGDFWQKNSNEIKKIINDLRKLIGYEPEIVKEQQTQLENLYSILSKTYVDFKHNKPPKKNLSNREVNLYLKSIVFWFKQRYAIVNRNPMLRRLYKKRGCDFLFGKKIDVFPEGVEIRGPCLLRVRMTN